MRQLTLFTLVACLSLATLPVDGQAAILKAAIFDAPPFIILGKDRAEPSGIDIDLIRELARRMNCRPVFQEATWVRCLALMKSGGADVLSSVYRNAEREAFLHYLDIPYLTQLPIAFFFRADNGVRIRRYEDIYRWSPVGVLQGASYFTAFDNDDKVVRETVGSQEQITRMLVSGRLALAACYVDTQNYYNKTLGFSGILRQSEFIWNARAEVFITLSRKSALFSRQAEFDRVWAGMVKEGFVQATVDRYRALYR